MTVFLGGIILDGFEAPAGIRFGGDQRLAVHRLPGGARVIDAMGPDESDVAWRGFLSGSDATSRARQLDTMRQSGTPVVLSWATIFYTVILSRVHFIYHSPWWIQCEITCTVVTNPWNRDATSFATTIASIDGDLNAAGAWIDASAAESALQAIGSAAIGTQAYAAATVSVSSIVNQISSGIALADLAMSSDDVATLAATAGTLAELTAARGYLGRAATNLANIGG